MNQQLGWIWWTSWNIVFVWNVAIGYIPPVRQFTGHSGSMLCLWHNLELPGSIKNQGLKPAHTLSHLTVLELGLGLGLVLRLTLTLALLGAKVYEPHSSLFIIQYIRIWVPKLQDYPLTLTLTLTLGSYCNSLSLLGATVYESPKSYSWNSRHTHSSMTRLLMHENIENTTGS